MLGNGLPRLYGRQLLFLMPLKYNVVCLDCSIAHIAGAPSSRLIETQCVLLPTPPQPGSEISPDWSKPIVKIPSLTRDWFRVRHVTQFWPMRNEGGRLDRAKGLLGKDF